MKSITASSDLLYNLKKSKLRVKRPNEVNLWREVKRRWLIGAILIAVFLAVVAPNLGAYGGPLQMHQLSHLVRAWIYFIAGSRAIVVRPSRVMTCVAIQSHIVAPAIAAFVAGMRVAEYRVASGLITLSLGNNCPWLSIALQSRDNHTLSQVVAASATGWIVGLVTAPISVALACGHYQLPPFSSVLPIITATIPFLLGYLYNRYCNYYLDHSTKSADQSTNSSEQSTSKFDQSTKSHDKSSELCAVLLVYGECCEQLMKQGSGGVAISDVIGSLVVVVLWLFFCAMSCVLLSVYCKDSSKVVLMSALPKSIDNGWHMSSICATMGL